MKSEQVLGRVAIEVFPRLGPSGIEAALKRALGGQVVRVADVLVPKHAADGHDVWEVCTFAPHRDAEGQIVGVIGLVHDVTERHLAEETFRTIVEGTASATGADFFTVLVRSLASALRAHYAYATACDDGVHAKGLAFWDGEKFGPYWEFDVTGTPCMKVVRGEVCHYSQGLQELFPHEEFLKQIDAHSYLGVPMLDVKGRVVGHLAILHNQPMALSQRSIEGLLRDKAGDRFEVFSAGTRPVGLNPNAVKALPEIGIDISGNRSKSVDEFAGQQFDYVFTVCDNARESCPIQ